MEGHFTRKDSPRSGIALVIVLGSLVFLSALVVAFLVQMGTELKSSRLYAEGASARILSQSATNIVMAEIKEATKAEDGGVKITWASQPGMIRTYDETGNAHRFFRLYSWDNMSGSGSFDPASPANEIPLTGTNAWDKNKALYTDLNEPVAGSYPIIDGNGINQLTRSPSNNAVPAYLGYNTDGDALPDIDGFEIDPSKVTYSPGTPASYSNHPVPMPVKWLYVLADGRVIAPTGGGGNTATFTEPNQPSAANPIVGRIAFWTDDETCKVNINTASEGVYSDYPRSINTFTPPHTTSQKENLLAYCQPMNGEYQRYPGHPSTTCLSTIFKYPPGWTPPVAKPAGATLGAGYSAAEWKDLQWSLQLAKIAPRISNESSSGLPAGSRAATINTVNLGDSPAGVVPSVAPDPDRLYTHPDELEFRPDLNSLAREESDTALSLAPGVSVFNKDALKRAGFFLTASSRAPDVNLFDQPRVSIWPLHIIENPSHRTAFDRLIAFCSTLRNDLGDDRFRFYFQRQDATNQSTDLPDQNAASVTGLGRNRMLLEYLRELTGRSIPGFGGSYSAKYSTTNGGGGIERDQILTEMFDYIRSTNLSDASISPAGNRYTKVDPAVGSGATAGIGQVVPIVDTKTATRGLGRFPTLQGCAIVFIACIDGDDPVVSWQGGEWKKWDRISPAAAPVWIDQTDPQTTYTSQVNRTTGNPLTPPQAVPANTVRVQALFIPQFFNPAVGSVWYGMNFKWRVEGMQDFAINGQSLGYPSATGSQSVVFTSGQPKGQDNAAYGDQLGLNETAKTSFIRPSVSTGIDIPKDQKMVFTGANLTFTIRDSNDQVVQTIPLHFPGGAFPAPGIAPGRLYNYSKFNGGSLNGTWPGPYNMRYFSITGSNLKTFNPQGSTPTVSRGGRLEGGDLTTAAGFFIDRGSAVSDGAGGASLTNPTPVDIVRSVSAAPGDMRLIAGKSQTVTSGAGYPFEKVNPEYWEENVGVAGMHTFVTGNQEAYYGTALGKFVEVGYEGYTGLAPALPNEKGNYPGVCTKSRFPYSTAQFINPSPGTKGASFASEHTAAPNIPVNGVAVGKDTSYDASSGDIRGDWDNAPSNLRDGAFINKPDEGDKGTSSTPLPYDWKIRTNQGLITSSLFTPNRQIASAAMFGSLPTGVWSNRPWQTLLFRYEPTGRHPGCKNYDGTGNSVAGMPADHLWLDLFHMPVVEPYAISEPLSTAGRINMNYQMVPFTYITRSTGIHAVLKSEKLITIPNSRANIYKTLSGSTQMSNIRTDIDVTETLKGFEAKFATGEIFRSATEICELPLIAKGSLFADAATYWNSFLLSGDNSRERPYASVYPRLTTKSNTFTIHVRAQSLKKAKGSADDALVWREGRDQVTGEYRGSQTIERFVDPNDPGLPDYADVPAPADRPTLSNFYKFRVVSTKQFAP